jgi:large subunit ribosomal protein L6
MSRIGKQPITVPANVTVTISNDNVVVKGPKGELVTPILSQVTIKFVDGVLTVERKRDEKEFRAAHGLTRTLLNNSVEGVTKGFRKTLDIQGVGYRANKAGKNLNLTLGLSHPVAVTEPDGIVFTVEGTNVVHIDGFDKQRVGQIAAEIRSLRPPEPYKGKGIRYRNEVVRKKVGKTGKAGKK